MNNRMRILPTSLKLKLILKTEGTMTEGNGAFSEHTLVKAGSKLHGTFLVGLVLVPSLLSSPCFQWLVPGQGREGLAVEGKWL